MVVQTPELQYNAARIWTLPAALGVVVALTTFKFLIVPTPQGSDTPNYLYASNLVIKGGDTLALLGDGRELTFLTLSVYRFFIESLLGQSLQVSLITFPIVLVSVLSIMIFRYVRVGTGNETSALLSMIFTGLSFFLARMSIDFFAQTLGLSLIFAIFTIFNSVSTAGQPSGKASLLIFGLSTASAFAHAYSWVILSMMLVTYYVIGFLAREKILFRYLIYALLPGFAYVSLGWVLSPVIAVLLPHQWYERSLATASIAQGLLFPFRTGEFAPLSLAFLQDQFASVENPTILILAVIGSIVLFVFRRRGRFTASMFAMTIVPTVLLLTGYSQSYRLIMLIPDGVLAGVGLAALPRRVPSVFKNYARTVRMLPIRPILIVAILVLAFSFASSRSFIKDYVYYPGQSGVGQLQQIEEKFGFGNPKILVLVQDPAFAANAFQYARGITGANVYQGSLIDLLLGRSFVFGGIIPIKPDLKQFETIVMPPELYHVGNLERRFAIIDDGLYEIKSETLLHFVSISSIVDLADWTTDRSQTGWFATDSSLPHNATFVMGGITLTSTEIVRNSWATYELPILNLTHGTYALVSVSGSLVHTSGIVEVWYSKNVGGGISLGPVFKSVFNGNAILTFPLDPTLTLSKVRVALYSGTNAGLIPKDVLSVKFVAIYS